MHVFLLSPNLFLPDGTTALASQVSTDHVQKVLQEFRRLLDQDPREEEVQQYIKTHPILLAHLGAVQLFFKPPILNKYVADFGIVNSKNELWLIEIERPGMPLLNKEGFQTAELSKAFSQPNAWRTVIDEHKRTVIDCIPRCPKDIGRVRYLVIAGRTKPHDPEALHRLVFGSTDPEFMTYDHLVLHVEQTVRAAVS